MVVSNQNCRDYTRQLDCEEGDVWKAKQSVKLEINQVKSSYENELKYFKNFIQDN